MNGSTRCIRAALMLLAGFVAAGCSPSTITATTSPPPATATTIPTATQQPTSFSPADWTNTPAPPPTITHTPDLSVLPIVDGESGEILLGWKDGEWLDNVTTASMATGVIHYRLFKDGLQMGEKDWELIPMVGVCPNPIVNFGDVDLMGTIAVPGDWNVTPRSIEQLSTDIPEYTQLVEDYLTENGLESPDVQITAVERVDLDDDGADEVLISASKLRALNENGLFVPEVRAGDYSTVLIRRVGENGVETISLGLETYHETRSATGSEILWSVRDALDLNGDGRLELIMSQRGYEYGFTEIYEVDATGIRRIARVGCSI